MEFKDYTPTLNFLKYLFRNCKIPEETYLNLRFLPGPDGDRSRFIKFKNLEQELNAKLNHYANENRNLYFGPSLRNKWDGSKKAISLIPAVWLDHDNFTSELEAKLKAFPFQPSLDVQTSLFTKRHFYWILKEPLTHEHIEEVEAILDRIAVYFCGDMASTDASHVLRLPFTLNVKPEYVPPLSVLLIDKNDKEYELSDFDSVLPPLPKSLSTNEPGWEEALWEGLPDGQRTEALKKLAGRYIQKRLQKKEVLGFMRSWNLNNKPPLPDEKVEKTVDSIWKGHYQKHPEDKPDVIQDIEKQGSKVKTDSFSRGEGRSLFEILQSPEKEPNYIVKPWMVTGEKGYLTADKKVGKTLEFADLCLHLGIGNTDWLGFHIPKPVKVLSIRFELADWKFDKRLRRMMAGLTKAGLHSNVIQKEPIFEFVRGFEITDQKDQDWLFKMIDKHEPEVLQLDPLYKMTALNLSDPSKGPLVIRANEKISERYPDLHRLTAHHNKKRQSSQSKNDFDSDSNSSYGVFQIFADMDYQIRVSSDGKEDPTFRWSFESNDEPIPGFSFKRNNETFLHYRVDFNPEESEDWIQFNKDVVNVIAKFKEKNPGNVPDRNELLKKGLSKRKLDDARKQNLNRGWKFWDSNEGNVAHIRFDLNEI